MNLYNQIILSYPELTAKDFTPEGSIQLRNDAGVMEAAAVAKLAALGLTTDDLKALGLGGN